MSQTNVIDAEAIFSPREGAARDLLFSIFVPSRFVSIDAVLRAIFPSDSEELLQIIPRGSKELGTSRRSNLMTRGVIFVISSGELAFSGLRSLFTF